MALGHDDGEGNRLNPIEAERIAAIIEDTTEKLNFLDSVTPDVLQHRDELSKFIGDEIKKTMSEQRMLEAQYKRLIEERSSMKGGSSKTRYKQIQEEIQDVSRALKESTTNLVRNLKENPNVSGNNEGLAEEPSLSKAPSKGPGTINKGCGTRHRRVPARA